MLVIGAGGAGLRAAIEASAAGVKVGLLCKSLLGKAHTVMSSEVAAQAALDVVQQVPSEVTITASAESVEFVEPRGSLVFKTDGKNGTVEVPGGSIKVKSRWDKGSLRQEFSSTQRILKRAWSVDESGHLILTQHVESVAMTTKEVRAVFDRQ